MAKAKGFSEEAQQPFEDSNGLQSVPHARLKIDNAGRIVIPAEMRAAMLVKPGDMVTARVEHGEFRITSPDVAVRRAQNLARKLIPDGVSLVDELIADRREEARREAEEADAWRKAHGLPPLE
ncbi:MAG: AbrB/MazE/SpoVT family DNA-binding domain-containing protein [Pseudomonadota bacterium]|nr:AbrB/MazE/SpoVT family DNA-binding domain-containing protein [Pseudomonadota bacterium]